MVFFLFFCFLHVFEMERKKMSLGSVQECRLIFFAFLFSLSVGSEFLETTFRFRF